MEPYHPYFEDTAQPPQQPGQPPAAASATTADGRRASSVFDAATAVVCNKRLSPDCHYVPAAR